MEKEGGISCGGHGAGAAALTPATKGAMATGPTVADPRFFCGGGCGARG